MLFKKEKSESLHIPSKIPEITRNVTNGKMWSIVKKKKKVSRNYLTDGPDIRFSKDFRVAI